MKRIALSCLSVALAAGLGSAQSTKRHVEIQVTLPNGANHVLLQVLEGNLASVDLPTEGKFGFVPTVKSDDDTTLIVAVLDLRQTPSRTLDRIETSLRTAAVRTNTKPVFAIKVTYMSTSDWP